MLLVTGVGICDGYVAALVTRVGILDAFVVALVTGIVLLFVSICFVVVATCALSGRRDGDTRDGGGGDRGADILVFSVNCTGNIRAIGTGVGRNIDSVVAGVVVGVIVVVVDVEELVRGD